MASSELAGGHLRATGLMDVANGSFHLVKEIFSYFRSGRDIAALHVVIEETAVKERWILGYILHVYRVWKMRRGKRRATNHRQTGNSMHVHRSRMYYLSQCIYYQYKHSNCGFIRAS